MYVRSGETSVITIWPKNVFGTLSDVSCPGSNGHSGNFYFKLFGLIWLFIVIICIVTAFHLQSALQTITCFTEFVSGTLRKCTFFIDNKDFISALREKCTSGLLTKLPAALPYFQKSQNWGREREVESRQKPQRKGKKPKNNASQSDIQTTTLPSSPFLNNKCKHLHTQKWVLWLWIWTVQVTRALLFGSGNRPCKSYSP